MGQNTPIHAPVSLRDEPLDQGGNPYSVSHLDTDIT